MIKKTNVVLSMYNWWDALLWARAGEIAVDATIKMMRWWKC